MPMLLADEVGTLSLTHPVYLSISTAHACMLSRPLCCLGKVSSVNAKVESTGRPAEVAVQIRMSNALQFSIKVDDLCRFCGRFSSLNCKILGPWPAATLLDLPILHMFTPMAIRDRA